MFLNRVNIVLAMLLVICAMALVTAQQRARTLFVDHERARTQARQLETRWNELQVQQTQFAKTSLIDAKARRDMGMQSVPADHLVHLEQRFPTTPVPAGSATVQDRGPHDLAAIAPLTVGAR